MCLCAIVLLCTAMVLLCCQPRRHHEHRAFVPVRKVGKASQASFQPRARLSPPPSAERVAGPCSGTVLLCGCVQDMLLELCGGYRCMRVPRPQIWGASEVQPHVDRLARSWASGRDEGISEAVRVARAGGAWEGQLAADLRATACRLVGEAVRAGLPAGLGQQIQFDIEEVGMVLAKMLPATEEVIVKLELMGENVCSRWHQDHYTGRAIVTYNGCGTEYTDHDNVNFWELDNCGNKDHILRDKDRVFSVDSADVFFMKGKLFPGAVNGLVHKSPDKRYRANGEVLNRLCLKLDVA